MNSAMTMPTQTRRGNPRKRLGPLHEPAAFVDGPNQYQYVGGDPVGAVDPEGLATTQPNTMPTTQPAYGRLPRNDDPKENEGGWAFVMGANFAGKGWARGMPAKLRPMDTWDFIAKVHDLNYWINDISIEFRFIPQRKEMAQSRKAKSDYIFRVLHRHSGSANFWGPGSRAIFDSSGYEYCQRSEFRAGDGFKNVLRADDVPNFPGTYSKDVATSYLMIPWQALTKAEQQGAKKTIKAWQPGTPNGRGGTTGGGYVNRSVPNYLAVVDRDTTKDWRGWGKEYFGPLWDIAAAVTSMTGSESKPQ